MSNQKINYHFIQNNFNQTITATNNLNNLHKLNTNPGNNINPQQNNKKPMTLENKGKSQILNETLTKFPQTSFNPPKQFSTITHSNTINHINFKEIKPIQNDYNNHTFKSNLRSTSRENSTYSFNGLPSNSTHRQFEDSKAKFGTNRNSNSSHQNYTFKNSSLLNNNIFNNNLAGLPKKEEINIKNKKNQKENIEFKETSDFNLKIEANTKNDNGHNNSPIKKLSYVETERTIEAQKKQPFKEYAYKEEHNPRFRPGMEDCHKVCENFLNDPSKTLFTLYDGHGGAECAKYARERIPEILSKALNSETNVKNSLISTFQKVDEEIRLSISDQVGTTACIAYICEEKEGNETKRVIYIANVGDSRATLVSRDGYKRLSYDHKCSDYSEIQRIRGCGGILIEGRVLGQLILSRALGDHSLKRYGVICTPYVQRFVVGSNDDYLVIASDGLWDVISDADLMKFIKLSSSQTTQQLVNFLVRTALDLGSQDNISCLIIKLN